MAKPKTFNVGDKVRLTAKHLRATGQYTGRAPFSAWTVTGHSGPWVITDEPAGHPKGYYSEAELAADPTLAFLRIHPGNLELVKR